MGEISYGTGINTGPITLKVSTLDDTKVSIYQIYSNGNMKFFNGYQAGEEVVQRLKEKYGPTLCEKNPDLPHYENTPWSGEVNQIEENQVDDFIQFYHDVVEEIYGLEAKKR